MSKVSILGAGAWGTALAIVLSRNGTHEVRLWAREKEVAASITTQRSNAFLPSCAIPENVAVTTSYEDCLQGAEIVICAVPSQHCRVIFQDIEKLLAPEMLLVSATKGLEQSSLMRMTSVITDVVKSRRNFSPRIGALSGPSFATEVARGDPTAITIASKDAALAEAVQQTLSDSRFRVYRNDDVIGVELGGALKNIIAIASGVCDGLGLGHNSIAALITRGLSEITRLVVACGGNEKTMSGLAGLGDLVLTCTGELSRNRSVGVELGRGQKLPEILSHLHGTVAEGVLTTYAAVGLARSHQIEMPITEQMHAILREGKAAKEAIRDLMARSAKSEIA